MCIKGIALWPNINIEMGTVVLSLEKGKGMFVDVRFIYRTFWANGLKTGPRDLSKMVLLKVNSTTKLFFALR